MRIIEIFMGLGLVLIDTSNAFFDFLGTTWEVAGTEYAIYELMFGGGLVFALTYIFVSWVADLLP